MIDNIIDDGFNGSSDKEKLEELRRTGWFNASIKEVVG